MPTQHLQKQNKSMCVKFIMLYPSIRILEVQCRNMTLEDGLSYSSLAHRTPGYVGADLVALVREAALCAVNR